MECVQNSLLCVCAGNSTVLRHETILGLYDLNDGQDIPSVFEGQHKQPGKETTDKELDASEEN